MRTIVFFVALILCFSLLRLIYERFVISVLATKSTAVQQAALASALHSFPTSPRLQARYADVLLQQVLESPQTIVQAETAAMRAVQLSPFDAKNYLLLAAAKSVNGELAAEATHLQEALAVAPSNAQIHWRLANVLLRSGKIEVAVDEFRSAVTANPALLPLSLDLLWQLADGELNKLKQATGDKPGNQLVLAQFLLQKSRVDDAIQIVNQIDPETRLAAPETGGFLNDLLTGGKLEAAHQLWMALRGSRDDNQPLLWNGSFETASPAHLSQFDWQLRSSEYAQLTLDSYVVHSGTKALRLDFTGRDTTRLSNEIRQMIVLRPGARYRLSCFVRTAKLFTPEGPRVAITTQDGARVIAATNPITTEAANWQPLTLDFSAPPQTAALLVTVQRLPKTSYDDPTHGTIWFDDFSLTALP